MKSNFNMTKVSKIVWHKGFLGGIAMASPFYAEFFPWNFLIFLVLLFLFFLKINFSKIKTIIRNFVSDGFLPPSVKEALYFFHFN